MFTTTRECYCAFCKTERTIYAKKHVSFIDVGLAALASSLLMLALWQDFDPKVFVIFAFAAGFSEVFIQVRWRVSIPCPHCGFDPVLYKKNPEKAAKLVTAFLDRRREDPISLLRPVPKLPVLKKKKPLPPLTVQKNRAKSEPTGKNSR